MTMDQPEPSDDNNHSSLDIRDLFATIGEYEMTKRMMVSDLAQAQKDIEDLREEIKTLKGQ